MWAFIAIVNLPAFLGGLSLLEQLLHPLRHPLRLNPKALNGIETTPTLKSGQFILWCIFYIVQKLSF